jgi:hypothetical protein
LHRLPRLEHREELVGHWHLCSSSRVPTCPRAALPHRERPEPAKLNPAPSHQRVRDLAQDRVHDRLNLFLVEMRVLRGDAEDQFGLDHGASKKADLDHRGKPQLDRLPILTRSTVERL